MVGGEAGDPGPGLNWFCEHQLILLFCFTSTVVRSKPWIEETLINPTHHRMFDDVVHKWSCQNREHRRLEKPIRSSCPCAVGPSSIMSGLRPPPRARAASFYMPHVCHQYVVAIESSGHLQ